MVKQTAPPIKAVNREPELVSPLSTYIPSLDSSELFPSDSGSRIGNNFANIMMDASSNPKHGKAGGGVSRAADPPSSSSTTTPTTDALSDKHTLLTNKLSQYTRGSDRRQVLRTLNDIKLLPKMHVLKNVWVEDIAAAEREAAGERASLNGVKFLQVKRINDISIDDKKPVDSYFLQTLREICGHMCDMDGVDGVDPMALYGGLLLRLSRTVSERDALEHATQWCCGKGELVVLPLKRRHHDGPDKGTSKLAVPIDLEVYVESGNVHAKVTMRHEMGLYKRTDLEAHGLSTELSPWNALILAQQNPSMQVSSMKQLNQIQYNVVKSSSFTNLKPWVFIDCDVMERINFGTGSSVRMLHLSVPDDKNSGYVKK